VQLARGLVIARDGTLYFTQIGGVGRRLPDGTLETDWATFGDGATLAGLALDAANDFLFATVPDFAGADAASVYRVDTATGVATPVVMGGTPFGITVGPDGMLYFGVGANDQVLRVSALGAEEPTPVTTSPVPSARGVAFEASGTLLVASASPGSILRLTLSSAGTETDRQLVTSAPTPDSIALDATGRIYFTSEFGGFLSRMNPDGSGLESLETSLSSPFALDFGHGALSTCALFYVSAGTLRSLENDVPGATTIWH
jgi:streptogramin lyase